ncbi:MAG: hypothetical protein UX81_C0002G0042 [Parcubacteria group bacterium GW2011_GWA2_47_12]|nr:MAG: hypothetical protein UX81_C0002G0042 [Parcubacteria group bacterium GW2011_GWA2_47_12]
MNPPFDSLKASQDELNKVVDVRIHPPVYLKNYFTLCVVLARFG